MIKLEHIYKDFETNNTSNPINHVLKDLNLVIKDGEFVTLIGSNGFRLQLVDNDLGTFSGEFVVDGVSTCTGISITCDGYLSVRILSQIISYLCYFGVFDVNNLGRVDSEEDVFAQRFDNFLDRFRSRCYHSVFLYRFYDRRNNRSFYLLVSLAQVDSETSQCVEVPVSVSSLLRVVVVAQDIGVTLYHEADSVAQTEVEVDTTASEHTNFCTVPEIFQQVSALVAYRLGDIVHLAVVECDIGTATEECAYVEHTVRVPAAEQVGQVEHEVKTRSYIFVFVVVGIRCAVGRSLISVPAALALPCVGLQTDGEYRTELITKTQLYVR